MSSRDCPNCYQELGIGAPKCGFCQAYLLGRSEGRDTEAGLRIRMMMMALAILGLAWMAMTWHHRPPAPVDPVTAVSRNQRIPTPRDPLRIELPAASRPAPLVLDVALLGLDPKIVSRAFWMDLEQTTPREGLGDRVIVLTQDVSSGQAVLRIDMRDRSEVCIHVYHDQAPTGHTVNIGDSRTNNGFAGDAGSQSRDSELQLSNGDLLVWGDDHGPTGKARQLGEIPKIVTTATWTTFRVRNGFVAVDPHGDGGSGEIVFESPYLYALAGQEDTEGPENREIYVSLNRVINSAGRSGTGARFVGIQFDDAVSRD